MALVEGALDLCSASPRRYFFETAASFASHPKEAERLRHFASKEGRDELWYYNDRERRCVREFLDDFPSVRMPLGWMLTTAPRLRPRLFSIASASNATPETIHLTVTRVRWRTHYGRTRRGLCSDAVAKAAPGSGKLACWLVNGAIGRLPRDEAPLVLVCTGSGVAPLRSLVQDRVHRARHAGARIAPTLVFFGCRRERGDFLYREEWEALAGDPIALAGHRELRTFTAPSGDGGSDAANSSVSEVCPLEGGFVPAFSRDGDAKDYVQHRIASHAMRVWRMLQAGAAVYVAGSSAKMPQDVRETMEKVVQACGKMSIDDARGVRARDGKRRTVRRGGVVRIVVRQSLRTPTLKSFSSPGVSFRSQHTSRLARVRSEMGKQEPKSERPRPRVPSRFVDRPPRCAPRDSRPGATPRARPRSRSSKD